MGSVHTRGAFQVMVIAMLISIFFVGEIRSSFPGSYPSYCTLNPNYCKSSGGLTLKRQLKKVHFVSFALIISLSPLALSGKITDRSLFHFFKLYL